MICILFLDFVRFAIDCKAGTTAEGQNLLANISTSRASLLQGQYLIKENFPLLSTGPEED